VETSSVPRIIAALLVGTLWLAGCGGGSSSGSSTITPTPTPVAADNVQPVTVDAGPAGLGNTFAVDTLFTSVTICVPGTTTCQTIDHIQVDTGSSGLRLLSTVLTLSLPLQTDTSNNAVVECTQFLDGFSWGPVRKADIQIAGETASAAAVQVIGDAAFPTVPSDCSSTGTAEDSVASFGANGILGVGPFIQDCGPGCGAAANNTVYYTCSNSTTCAGAAVDVTQQVTNPATLFATDNNGVAIQLPAVGDAGAATATGSLFFGIGTQSNNDLGNATVLTVSKDQAQFTVTYNGTALPESFIDSGSNGFYFPDSTINLCASNTSAPGFFCPSTTLNLSATIQSAADVMSTVTFNIANAATVLGTGGTITAVDNIGGPASASTNNTSFDFGLPFFFGRTVFTAFEQHNTSGGEGPYFAF
jgi:hypothetical protein